MPTFHIHITGMVQGVGFRPYVCRLAALHHITGWVSNGNDGVHIEYNCVDEAAATQFYRRILKEPPANAIISKHHFEAVEDIVYPSFVIAESITTASPDILLTPDIATCANCKKDLVDYHNRRHHYAFTTCLECGPRYSITNALPYDREHTTMAPLAMCGACTKEYNDIYNRRHYSQTNSCIHCPIPISLFNNDGEKITDDPSLVLRFTIDSFKEGKIIAVKGIGGYLLMCDATNEIAIKNLRERKHRPAKPFAVLYKNVAIAEKDVLVSNEEKALLEGKVAPIVLCSLKQKQDTGLCTHLIAPTLDKLGVMLPYTPLLQLIADKFAHPLIATSGNLSGSPIIYTDDDALLWLCDYADYVLAYEREIVTPQDDSVVQLTDANRQIILRRSRGLAPGYYPNPFSTHMPMLAMGAELKAAFALIDRHNLYISQYLGDQESYESQESYKHTLKHLSHLLHIKPGVIIVDKHPHYYVSELGRKFAAEQNLPLYEVQHHIAHFCAVMKENDLMATSDKVLGVVWDGTGYGNDKQIWGSEFFVYSSGAFERVAHLEYFPHLAGDKMSREPRVSAVALLRNNKDALMLLKDRFVERERLYYLRLIEHNSSVQTSSMGRFLDGIAAILDIHFINSYEGEAAMKLEATARSCEEKIQEPYPIILKEGKFLWMPMLQCVIDDKIKKQKINYIAKKVFVSLVHMIRMVAAEAGVKKIAFSGGVFQNALLAGLVEEILGGDFELYFHRQLSPNDECISFGQLAYVLNNETLK